MCVSVCVSVISEISGTGRRSATLLAPTWRASLVELQRLLVEFDTTHGSGGKAFRSFSLLTSGNHALHDTTVQYLRNLAVFL